MQINDVIGAYIALRDKKEAVEKQHKAELAPINEQIEKLGAWLQKQLLDQQLENFRGAAGTAFLQSTTSCRVQDFDAFLEWVKQNGAWAFLEKRASKTVVQDYIESYKEVPPGLEVQQAVEVRVRRS